jgi:hypothetical protein
MKRWTWELESEVNGQDTERLVAIPGDGRLALIYEDYYTGHTHAQVGPGYVNPLGQWDLQYVEFEVSMSPLGAARSEALVMDLIQRGFEAWLEEQAALAR